MIIMGIATASATADLFKQFNNYVSDSVFQLTEDGNGQSKVINIDISCKGYCQNKTRR